jgi:Raf kinase inhibitor-like YbhB/YbcL family protein
MLEKMPAALGKALRSLRSGHDKVVSADAQFARVPATIELTSSAFEDGGMIPPQYTADGEGRSPPLIWKNVPAGTESLVLIIEDPDAPAIEPLVHLIAWTLPADLGGVAEGTFPSPKHEVDSTGLGRNSYLKAGYLPPDPPTGHGAHTYYFQIFALDYMPEAAGHPGRKALLEAVDGHVLAKGSLCGTYMRPAGGDP